MKNKIILIPSINLPIPATKGGAVQNLIDFFIDYNEESYEYDIVIFSVFNKKSKKISNKFKNTKIFYIPFSGLLSYFSTQNITLISGISYKILNFYFVRYIKFILTFFIKNKSCIIYENTPFIFGKMKPCRDTKTIIHLYNDYIKKNNDRNEKIIRNVDRVVTVSDYGRKFLYEIIPNDKTDVIYNGIDVDRFITKDDYSYLREMYNIKNGDKVILFVGRLVEEKGIRELIESVLRIDDRFNIKLLIIGNKLYSGDVYDRFYERLKTLTSTKKCRFEFVGHVSYERLHEFYSISDIGVLPSTYDEPFSMSALEYMASGLGVVVTDVGGFPEMIKDSGIMVPNDENLVTSLMENIEILLQDDVLLKQYGDKARERVREFNKENYCINKSNLIKKIINKGDK